MKVFGVGYQRTGTTSLAQALNMLGVKTLQFPKELYYDIDDRWSIGAGYRTIEGGADNDTVYTFSWFHQAVISAVIRF